MLYVSCLCSISSSLIILYFHMVNTDTYTYIGCVKDCLPPFFSHYIDCYVKMKSTYDYDLGAKVLAHYLSCLGYQS